MEWITWHLLYVLFWLFGTRIYSEPTLVGGEWRRKIGNYVLKIRVNTNYCQHAYTLFRDRQAIAAVVF